MASIAYSGVAYFSGAVALFGDRVGNVYATSGPVQPVATAAAPLTRYVMRGQNAGATETWVDGYAPNAVSPTGHATTEVSHIKIPG